MLQIAIDKIPVKKVGIKGLKGRKGKTGSSMLSLLFGGIGRQEMEAGGEMDDLAVEAGGGEDVVDGAGDVERRRADFGGGGLDEAVHPFEGDAVGGEDERGRDGVDAEFGGPVDGGGEGGVAEGFFGEGVWSGDGIGVVDAVVENIDDISFFANIMKTAHQFKRDHEIDSECILHDRRRGVRERRPGIDGGVVDEDVRRIFLENSKEFRRRVREGEIHLDDLMDGRIREGRDEGLRLLEGRVAMDDDGMAFLREIAGDGRADAFG